MEDRGVHAEIIPLSTHFADEWLMCLWVTFRDNEPCTCRPRQGGTRALLLLNKPVALPCGEKLIKSSWDPGLDLSPPAGGWMWRWRRVIKSDLQSVFGLFLGKNSVIINDFDFWTSTLGENVDSREAVKGFASPPPTPTAMYFVGLCVARGPAYLFPMIKAGL